VRDYSPAVSDTSDEKSIRNHDTRNDGYPLQGWKIQSTCLPGWIGGMSLTHISGNQSLIKDRHEKKPALPLSIWTTGYLQTHSRRSLSKRRVRTGLAPTPSLSVCSFFDNSHRPTIHSFVIPSLVDDLGNCAWWPRWTTCPTLPPPRRMLQHLSYPSYPMTF
jgi:hypothetical protein